MTQPASPNLTDMKKRVLPSSISQVVTITKYELVNYFRSRRFFVLHWKMARCTYSIDSNARSLRGHNDRQRHLLLRPQHPESTVGILTLRSALSDCSSWLHVLLQFLVQEHLNVNPSHGYSVSL